MFLTLKQGKALPALDTTAQFSSQQLWLTPQGPRDAESHLPEEGWGPCSVPVPSARFWLCLVGATGVKAQLSLLGCTGRQEQPLQQWPEEKEACRRQCCI